MKKITIQQIEHHRNGVAGEPFDVVKFKEGRRKMLGIVFDDERYVAVFDRDLLAQDVITFGVNSWRGDDYEPQLRKAIDAHWVKLARERAETKFPRGKA
jgi:hypothetical protein